MNQSSDERPVTSHAQENHQQPHHHGHHHHHGAAATRAGARHRKPLLLSLLLVVAFVAVQLAVGLATGSLALLSDSAHMATDALGLALSLAAIGVASSDRTHRQRTFGLYRLEILAALGNTVLLFAAGGYVVFEAARRLSSPADVPSGPVLLVGLLGLAVSLVGFALLRAGAKESLNIRGAYLEVLSDALGSVGVVVSAVVLAVTGWPYIDPLVGATIGVLILPRAWRLGAEAVRILIQAAPPGIDLARLRADLSSIAGVVDVHDLHVWTLTSEMEVASAHVMVRSDADQHGVLDEARHRLAQRHGLIHATLQVEPDDHTGCDEVSW